MLKKLLITLSFSLIFNTLSYAQPPSPCPSGEYQPLLINAAANAYWMCASGVWQSVSIGGVGIPSGLITLIETSVCPTGWTEVSALNGKTLIGTVAANKDVGTTGGLDNITPDGSLTMNTFTDVINHTHTISITDPGHNHTQNSFAPRIINSGTAGTVGVQGASAASNANASNAATTATNIANTTGITASSSNPAGGVSSITPTGSFSGNSFDNRSAFIKVIFCKKD